MNFERPKQPRKPDGMSIGETIAWLNEHYPVANSERSTAEAHELAVPDPKWYEHLAPVEGVRQLTPAMFGLVDTDEKKYGWAQYSWQKPDNLLVQQRAAMGLVQFSQDKQSMRGLMNVYYSLEQDGIASKGYNFRPPVGTWDMPKYLWEYRQAGDIEGAAHYTAELLFSPWQEY